MSTDWTGFDAPALRDAASRDLGDGRREALLRVDGMHCSACARRIERALAPLARDVRVHLGTGTVEVDWDARRHPFSAVLGALDAAGFTPAVTGAPASSARAERRAALKRIGVALIFGMQVMMLASGHYFGAVDAAYAGLMRWAQLALATPVAFFAGWPFLVGAVRALRARAVTMDVPVATAITLAWTVSAWHTVAGSGAVYFDSVVMFVLLLLTARLLQDVGRARASERVRRLAEAQPAVAVRVFDGASETVPLGALAVGDRVLVAPGAAVPVDGVLVEGASAFDEALLSGESVPVTHAPGEEVLAGSINAGHAPVIMRAVRVGQGSALSQIARLLQRAEAERPRVQVLADRVAGYFLTAMLALVAGALAFWWPQDPARALTVVLALLVATCPCALSLAVPATLAASASRLARRGVLLARADALLRLRDIDTVCFDKTGTLTTGAMRLDHVMPMGGRDAETCRRIAAALEAGSAHPIARALSHDTGDLRAEGLHMRADQGLAGRVGAHDYVLGAPERVAPQMALPPSAPEQTRVLLLEDGAPLALFGLTAEVRPEARSCVGALQGRGLDVELLSGDGEEPVRALARRLGLRRWHARRTPGDKLARVRMLAHRGRRVLAVGDGVNDAPLLAAAQVSVAMASGSALSQASADVLLLGDRLDGLSELLAAARHARVVVAQNLIWAAGYNAVMVPLAFAGWLTPWLGALGMGLSSLVVVANALRLARPPRPAEPSGSDLRSAPA